LRKRSEDHEDVIQRRLITASREIQNYDRYNYILVNDRLPDSIEMLQAIVRSERLLRSGGALSSDELAIVKVADCCRLSSAGDRLKPILESFQHSVSS
jgi:hypothetical protein